MLVLLTSAENLSPPWVFLANTEYGAALDVESKYPGAIDPIFQRSIEAEERCPS